MPSQDKNQAESREIVRGGLLSLAEVRVFLGGVSRGFLYAEFESGRLPFVKVGRRRMVPRNALVSYAAARMKGGVEV